MSEAFDPEAVERFDSEDWAHVRCVKESDYDKLLALYRGLNRRTQLDSIMSAVVGGAQPASETDDIP